MTSRDRSDSLRDDDALDEGPSLGSVFRDFIAFEVKLFVDGLKDVILAQGAVLAMFAAFFHRRDRGAPLRALMRLGERFERWLRLYEPVSASTEPEDDELAALKDANRIVRAAERRMRPRDERR